MRFAAASWRALGLAAIGMGAIALGAAVPAAAQTANPSAKKGGNLIHAHVSGMDHLDPANFCTTVALEPAMHIYESLVMMGGDYSAKPMLASKVEVDPEGKKFVFTLRKGVKFHNGKEMTSADVLATMQRYAKTGLNAAALANVASMDTPDPYTFIINLKETSAVLLDVMKTPCYPMSIIPAEEAAKGPREITPIGTGPFRVAEFVKDSHLLLRRFDDYTQDTSATGPDGFVGKKTANVETLRYNFLPEVSARVAAIQAGAADIALIDVEQIDRFKGRTDAKIEKVFPGCMHTAILRADQGLTRNVKIRQAIAALVDVEDMATVSQSVYKLNPSMLYPDSPYYIGDQMKQYYDQKNVAKAKQLLTEAGYKGEKIVVLTNSTYAYMRSQMLVLEQAMKAAGMNVELRVTDWITNANALTSGEGGWNVSMTGYCSQPLLGPQQWRPLLYGHTGLNNAPNEKLNAAYAKFFGSLDINVRKTAWAEAEHIILGEAYFLKLADAGGVVAIRNRVKGWQPWYALRNWDIWVE